MMGNRFIISALVLMTIIMAIAVEMILSNGDLMSILVVLFLVVLIPGIFIILGDVKEKMMMDNGDGDRGITKNG